MFADYANAFGETKVLVSEQHQWSLNSDSLEWKVSQCSSELTSSPITVGATVPGQVHLDLLDSGILS